METNQNDEATQNLAKSAKHMALSSLPTLDEGQSDQSGSVAQTPSSGVFTASVSDEQQASSIDVQPAAGVGTGSVSDATMPMSDPSAVAETGEVVDDIANATVQMPAEVLEKEAQDALDSLVQTPEDESNSHDVANDDLPPLPQGYTPNMSQGFVPHDPSFGMPQQEEPEKRGVGKKVLIGVGIAVGVLAIIYVGVAIFFMSHFLPNTMVNGENVSLMSVGDLSKQVSEIGASYSAHIAGDGLDLTIPAADIDFNYNGEAYGDEAIKQVPSWAWPLNIMGEHTYVVDKAISFNQDKLNAVIDAAVGKVNEGSTPPKNATMQYNEKSNAFEAVHQEFGTAVERDTVVSTVSNGVSTLQEEISLAEPELVQPTVTIDDQRLADGITRANEMIAHPIVLRIANTDAYTIDPKLMASWLSINADCNIVADGEAIKTWTEGPLSDQLDTVGKKRTFVRPDDGAEIEIEGGTYGWTINGEELANILVGNLQTANTAAINVPMKTEAVHWAPGGNEWGNRYIDVDLGGQYVRMYDESGNVIWDAYCVSGNPIYGGGTDTGVFYIYEKDSPMVLVGLDYNGDGEPDYKTPVTYWMPFDGGEGLHDANWRGSFGGSIYLYDGSHGCVNLPYYSAEELYGITEVGDVVVVHW